VLLLAALILFFWTKLSRSRTKAQRDKPVIDCLFGVFGFIPRWLNWKWVRTIVNLARADLVEPAPTATAHPYGERKAR
jgi:hypothetical protein